MVDKLAKINELAREICTLQNKCDDCSKHECMTKDVVEHIYRELIPEVLKDIKNLIDHVDHVVKEEYCYWSPEVGYNKEELDTGLKELAKQYGVEEANGTK